MNILIAGASGLIGQELSQKLRIQGHLVGHLIRGKAIASSAKTFAWSPDENKMDDAAIEWADAIIYLSGASVSEGRWTDARKKEIVSSRVNGLNLIAEKIQTANKKPQALISASAVGYYGIHTSEKIYIETDPAATDFFGSCCREWEEAADKVLDSGLRVVKLRIGVVLSRKGGALAKMAAPVRWYLGSPLGTGKQWVPWAQLEDVCRVFIYAIEQGEMKGTFNVASSEQVTNKQLMKSIGKSIGRPVFLPPVPVFLLKIILGEMAGIVTEGSRVSNAKLSKAGFEFKYAKLEDALKK
jgi:uncharacterized protein